MMKCAECENKECYTGKDCTNIREEIVQRYRNDKEALRVTKIATNLEGEHYMKLTRVEELMFFSKEMGYRNLGIAFCIGLSEEAKILEELLLKNGFEVTSVCCKVCGIDKRTFNLRRIRDEREEAMCNPIAQAEIMTRSGTDLNIIVGLCIGHDIIFSKYSNAPVTTLVVKDRVLAHNPIGALGSKYYRQMLMGE
jgi:uncharacterized metal-binding protein